MAGKKENMILYVVIAIMAIIIIYMVMNKSNGMQENFYQYTKPNPDPKVPKCTTPTNQQKYNSGFYNGQRLIKFYYRACLSSVHNQKWDNAYVLGTFDGMNTLMQHYHKKLNIKNLRDKNGKEITPQIPIINTGPSKEVFERKHPGIKCGISDIKKS